MIELLPCPFCGGSGDYFYSLQRVVCLACEGSATLEMWNQRTFLASEHDDGLERRKSDAYDRA